VELTVANFAHISSFELTTGWKDTRLEEALGAICVGTKLAVFSIFCCLILFLATITEWVLNRACFIVGLPKFKDWIIVCKHELLRLSTIIFDDELLGSFHVITE